MRACIIFNPTARGNKARRLQQSLNATAGRCTLYPTPGPGTAQGLAASAVQEGFDTIIAAGGDGTINEVVNGLAQTRDGLERARLGVLALGTVNVFAKELGLPSDLNLAWRAIENGQELRVDLPQVEFTRDGVRCRSVFVQLAGAGLDSRAIAFVNWKLKTWLGPGAYVWAGVKAMIGPQPRVIALIDDREVSGELVLIGNGRYYGGRIELFPGASMTDGRLEVRVFAQANAAAVLGLGLDWLWRRPVAKIPGLYFQASTVTLQSSESVPFELDGDNVGALPAKFSIAPRALRVMAPTAPH